MSSKVKTLSQIAAEYGIHISTLRRWIKPIRKDLQLRNRKLLLPWQTEILYDFLNAKK
jgi:transposase-like protein